MESSAQPHLASERPRDWQIFLGQASKDGLDLAFDSKPTSANGFSPLHPYPQNRLRIIITPSSSGCLSNRMKSDGLRILQYTQKAEVLLMVAHLCSLKVIIIGHCAQDSFDGTWGRVEVLEYVSRLDFFSPRELEEAIERGWVYGKKLSVLQKRKHKKQ